MPTTPKIIPKNNNSKKVPARYIPAKKAKTKKIDSQIPIRFFKGFLSVLKLHLRNFFNPIQRKKPIIRAI
jgi:hypothetical protein